MKKTLILITAFIFLLACSSQTEPLNIPFYKQQGPSCVQAQMRMALKYYYPEQEYTQTTLDQLTKRQNNQWTWFSQAIPVLVNEGLDAYYYSKTPYENLTPEFVNQFYGEDGPFINSVTNWPALEESIEFLKTSDRYQNKKLDWQEVEKSFQKGHVILMIIDHNVLIGQPEKPYAGHGITITYINQTHVVFHNSQGNPSQTAEKSQFQKAWNAKGTDNDVIIIKGKL